MTGKAYLIGAGPGDPELLTLKALRLIKSADVILHDDLVGPEILAFAPATAEVRNVGKRGGQRSTKQSDINELLVNYVLLDLQVVRLKGGDPLIFGRAGEEIEALRKANVPFEIVPGVTAALGAAAATQIPLTHRKIASSLLVLTGNPSSKAENQLTRNLDWPTQIPAATTVLIYMPGHGSEEYAYGNTAQQLLSAGVAGSTPCAVISRATCHDEEIHETTVNDLRFAPRLPSPALIVVGEVVGLGRAIPQQASSHFESEEDQYSLLANFPDFLATEVSAEPGPSK